GKKCSRDTTLRVASRGLEKAAAELEEQERLDAMWREGKLEAVKEEERRKIEEKKAEREREEEAAKPMEEPPKPAAEEPPEARKPPAEQKPPEEVREAAKEVKVEGEKPEGPPRPSEVREGEAACGGHRWEDWEEKR
ncbi:MAG: hypothetical protein QXT26_09035, partial [Thermoproteota archaeon]